MSHLPGKAWLRKCVNFFQIPNFFLKFPEDWQTQMIKQIWPFPVQTWKLMKLIKREVKYRIYTFWKVLHLPISGWLQRAFSLKRQAHFITSKNWGSHPNISFAPRVFCHIQIKQMILNQFVPQLLIILL